jgi:hypothetical protein
MNNEKNVEYFSTNNRQLAFALATAGCTFAPQIKNSPGPATNLYSLGFLRSKAICKGLSMEQAVDKLVSLKIPGNVTYNFVRNDTFAEAIKAWDKAVENIAFAQDNNTEIQTGAHSVAHIMEILCIHANNSVGLANDLPWLSSPLLSDVAAHSKDHEVSGKPDPRVVTEGKGKIWSRNASKETKEKLGI